MGEKRGKSKGSRLFGGLIKLLLILLAVAAIYVAVVVLESPEEGEESSFVVVEEPEAVERLQPSASNDARALAQLLGHRLPVWKDHPVAGDAANAVHDGQTVRQITLRYEGLVISAVRPASAAPLLLRSGLDVSLRSDLVALNLPAVLASRGGEYCLYFSDEQAAYAIYAPHAEEEVFLSVFKDLVWVQ